MSSELSGRDERKKPIYNGRVDVPLVASLGDAPHKPVIFNTGEPLIGRPADSIQEKLDAARAQLTAAEQAEKERVRLQKEAEREVVRKFNRELLRTDLTAFMEVYTSAFRDAALNLPQDKIKKSRVSHKSIGKWRIADNDDRWSTYGAKLVFKKRLEDGLQEVVLNSFELKKNRYKEENSDHLLQVQFVDNGIASIDFKFNNHPLPAGQLKDYLKSSKGRAFFVDNDKWHVESGPDRAIHIDLGTEDPSVTFTWTVIDEYLPGKVANRVRRYAYNPDFDKKSFHLQALPGTDVSEPSYYKYYDNNVEESRWIWMWRNGPEYSLEKPVPQEMSVEEYKELVALLFSVIPRHE